MAEIKLAKASEVPEGGMIMKEHGGKQILLAKVDGEVYALNDVCTHQGGPLHDGELGREDKYLVTCPWHDAHFDLRNGKVEQDTDWATDTEPFRVRVEGDDVVLEI